MVLLALGASACTVTEDGISIGSVDATQQASSENAVPLAVPDADNSDQRESGDAEPVEAEQGERESEERAEGDYGPRPVLQSFRLSADGIRWSGEPYGLEHTFTEVDDDEADIHYMSVGGDQGVRASYVRVGETLEICVETADGRGAGNASVMNPFFSSFPALEFAAYAPFQFDDGLRIPGGVLLGEYVGWEIIDPNFSFDGRPGHCYRSLGSYQWEGDPAPTETAFTPGDIACVLRYSFNSEYLVSYDFGGDGTFELETTRLADSYTQADLAHPAYAPANLGQAELDTILLNIEASAQAGDDYPILAG